MLKTVLVRGYQYHIRVNEVGRTGKIGLSHLCNYLQDAAHCDALKLGFGYPQMLENDRLWVLSRMSLLIDRLPASDDDIEVRTWVKSVIGPSSEREFAVLINDKVIVRASSLWFCLSASEHRPARIPMEEKLKKLVHDEQAVPGGAHKIKASYTVGEPLKSNVITAKYSDADIVNHVNNSAYVRWVMDEVMAYDQGLKPVSFTINYLGEVHPGDKVEIAQYTDAMGLLCHELTMQETEKPVCRTATAWKKA